jgi:hypothetical protein
MRPIQTVVTTHVLGAPEGWDKEKHGECAGLPVCVYEGVTYSYWKLSLWERLKLVFGHSLRLAVWGSGMPPVGLDVAPKQESTKGESK